VRCEYKTEGYIICHFSDDCAQYSSEKVTIVVDILVWNMVGICYWMAL
jgi:hypothetical protein